MNDNTIAKRTDIKGKQGEKRNYRYKKTQHNAGFLSKRAKNQLLDFSFFVHNVLANYRIKFLDLEFAWHVTLVFVGSVEVACTSR